MSNEAHQISVRGIRSTDINAVISSTNKGFDNIVDNINEFFSAVKYPKGQSHLGLSTLNVRDIDISRSIELIVGSETMFSVNANGVLTAQSMFSEYAEAKKMVLTEFPDSITSVGLLGQITWDGNDFYGYTNSGWISLTGGIGSPGSGGGAGEGSYGDTLRKTLKNASNGSIVVGDATEVKALNVKYALSRNNSYESGWMNISHNGTDADMTHEKMRVNNVKTGVTFTVFLSPFNEITLNYVVTNNIYDANMSYVVQKILI